MALPEVGVQAVVKDSKKFQKELQDDQDAVDEFGKSGKKSGDDFSAFDRIVGGSLERVGHAAIDMAMQAGQAIVGFVGDSIGAAGDFEAGMNQFAAVTGTSLEASGKDVEDFTQLFLDMGAETQFSAGQAQEAAIELAKGGRNAAQVYAELPAVLNLAAAGQLDLATSAEIAAKQMGIWGDQGVTAAQVADRLAQAANASTVDVDELALGMANVGGVAKVAGLSFDETVTALAQLSPGFSSAADAGTSFKTFLMALQPTTQSQIDAMSQLGLLAQDGSSKFYDATGSFIGMDKASQMLHDSLNGLNQAQQTAALKAIFGQDAFRAAAIIAEDGAKGFEDMASAMDATGSASDQAAKRQKGFNFAMESLTGSVETFQIVAGSKLLPVLTMLIEQALIPLVNAATAAAGAMDLTGVTQALISGVTGAADVITTGAVPALTLLAAVTLAYAVTNAPAMLGALVALIPQVVAATSAWAANALAVAAAAAPFALVVAAIAGVAIAYTDLMNKIDAANTAMLNGQQFWKDSTAAMESYGKATGDAKKELEPYANTVDALRKQVEAETKSLGERMTMGKVSKEQFAAEMEVINQHAGALKTATEAYNDQEQAIIKQTAATTTGTAKLQEMSTEQGTLQGQLQLTQSEFEKLQKQIETTYANGTKAVEDYTTREMQLSETLTQAKKDGLDQQEADQIVSLARQQAAAKAALGQQLVDYTLAQVQMGNVTNEQGQRIVDTIEKQFGTQSDISAKTFLQMTSDIDRYAASGGEATDALSSDLKNTMDTAVSTREEMDKLAKKYEAELIQNFNAGKIDADELRDSLEAIPSRVTSEVVVTKREITVKETRSSGDGGDADNFGTRAVGGPVAASMPYLVGEQGPELIFPSRSGYVATAQQTEALRSPVATPGQIGAVAAGSVTTNTSGDTWNVTLPPASSPDAGRQLSSSVRMLQLLRP